jgi:UDP-glucose 4-epimerase
MARVALEAETGVAARQDGTGPPRGVRRRSDENEDARDKGYSMRYLVTGGAGFIGSHLVETLLDDGHEVTVLDNFATGTPENLRPIRENVRLVHGSVLDALLVDELVEASDTVVHLAAAVGVRLIVERPLHSFLTNIRGSEIVLEAAHRYRSKVLVASTSEIYGKNNDAPFKEDHDRVLGAPQTARWSYSTSKAVDEVLAFAYNRERGLPTVVVRFFNTVGPRQTGAYGMVIPRLVEQALAGEPLTVYGNGQQSRCFCHVADVVQAVLAVLREPKAEGDVFNIGSSEEITIVDLAKRVIEATGSSSTIRMVPYDEAYKQQGFEDMRRRVPDTTKIKELVGWQPTRSLDQILADVIAHQRSRLPVEPPPLVEVSTDTPGLEPSEVPR